MISIMEKNSLLNKRTKALQNSVKYIRAFIDLQPSHVCVLDLKNNEIIDSSQKFLNTFGYIGPKELQDIFLNPKIVKNEVSYDYPELIESDNWIHKLLKNHNDIFRVEILIDNTIRTFEIAAYSLLYSSGVSDEDYDKNNFTVIILNDVSSLINEILKNKEKEKLLLKQYQKAMMGDLVATISHQIKQPLNVLSLLNYTIMDELEYEDINKEELLKITKDVESKIESMAETIDHFRNFFRDDKESDNFSMKEAINEAVTLLAPQFRENNIIIKKDLEELFINSYKIEFIQVVLNLLSNAKDALIENHIEDPQITIELKKQGNRSVATFKDNGGGIDKKVLPKIFNHGFTTKGQEGTGIGLNLVKRIVQENMNGEITARNEDGGAVFEIRF